MKRGGPWSGPGAKASARRFVTEAGYTEHFDSGECGDGGHGSRLYFRKPNAPANEHGWPLQLGQVDRLEGQWYATIFGDDD